MPFVIVHSRDPLDAPVRARLAESLSKAMILTEINRDTPEIRSIDWMWFKTVGAENWAVGGRFDDSVVKGRTMILAEIIAPEALLDTPLKLKAMREVTRCLREALEVPDSDDGTGLFAIITEVPIIQWTVNGSLITTRQLIDQVHGDVPQDRLDAIDAHFAGIAKMQDHFGIPK